MFGQADYSKYISPRSPTSDFTYTTTTYGNTEGDIWLDTVHQILSHCNFDVEIAMEKADKILAGYKDRFMQDDDEGEEETDAA